MWHEFGVLPTQKLKHTPHPQRRDVLSEIDRRFGAAVKQLGSAQFRTHTDISIASSLHHHVGAALGLAVPGQIRYDYVNLSGPNLLGRLDRVGRGGYHSFCLNDVASKPATQHEIDRVVGQFLERTFPWPSPWSAARHEGESRVNRDSNSELMDRTVRRDRP